MRLSLTLVILLAGLCLARPGLSQDAPPLSKGQSVYVPVYSSISHGNLGPTGKPASLLLSAMLSVRNTDPAASFTITSVKYYDSHGSVIREFVTTPMVVTAMGTKDFFIEHQDNSGGSGANFLVTWSADKPLNPPLIEAVNAYFFGTQSIAFTSPGRPIRVPGDGH